ncbi:hypothetical protein [Ornithinimicrobium cryptoxanthini]|uniref:Bacteriocin biosynthesis cyclodehydratase domain-containing protein n=1 Tax=Ornithinimicrobium cryptoxanthini TaxID=2934161 RepID=A0ABY4YK97_9MICO|nr:hypothetical protein [Ornithinimicrobium cryptoxanthini]USQ77138.1 hypothetical protein NF557_04265 [Ornithinimicrobium cryptoxanthini]
MSPMVRLRPSALPVRRAPGEVQFGMSPTHGIVLAGLTESESELLLSLSESAGTARDVTLAERFGVPLERVVDFIGALRSNGLLVPDTIIAGTHRLCVPGRGIVVELVREHLQSTGVDMVVDPDPTDLAAADLAVLCGRDAIAPDEGAACQRARVTHLPVVLRDGEVIIGPLIHPGVSACLRCLDLHRCDRDQAWPRILSQITTPTSDLGISVDAVPAQANTVAALVAMLARESLTTPQVATGVSWQISLPWPEVRTRVWTPHPHCDCLRPAPSAPA